MMKAADTAPIATAQMVARCTRLGSTFQPNSHSPRKSTRGRRRRDPPSPGRAEHVTDEPRVGRPVHPELELLHQPGHDADGDVDHQERAEEPGQPAQLGVAGTEPHRVQDRDQERQPDRHRHEEEVVDRRARELQAGQVELADVHLTSFDVPRTTWGICGSLGHLGEPGRSEWRIHRARPSSPFSQLACVWPRLIRGGRDAPALPETTQALVPLTPRC